MIDAVLNLFIAVIILLVCLYRTAEHNFFRRPHYYKIISSGSLISLALLLPLILPYSSDQAALDNLMSLNHPVPIMFGPFILACLARACLFLLRLRWPGLVPGYSQSAFFTVFMTGSALIYVALLWFLTFDWIAD